MSKYLLSEEAEKDIEAIFEFGTYKFGHAQAISYLVELQVCFDSLAKNPNIGRRRNEIRERLYSLPYASHIIFYRILTTHIRIVRVLYGGRDLVKFL